MKQGVNMNVIPSPIAGVTVWGRICSGRGLGKLYSVVVCGVPSWLLKYINCVILATTNLCKSV